MTEPEAARAVAPIVARVLARLEADGVLRVLVDANVAADQDKEPK